MAPNRPRRNQQPYEQRAELLWKWMLRLAGLGAFLYVLMVRNGDVAMGAYVIIGGLIGLPHVVSLQQMINARQEDG